MKANRALREGEPDYNLAEELISAISHGLGALFGVAALVLGLLAAAGVLGQLKPRFADLGFSDYAAMGFMCLTALFAAGCA